MPSRDRTRLGKFVSAGRRNHHARARALPSAATALDVLDSGLHILVSDDLYGGTYRLFERERRRSANLDFNFIDMSDASAIESHPKPNTRMMQARN